MPRYRYVMQKVLDTRMQDEMQKIEPYSGNMQQERILSAVYNVIRSLFFTFFFIFIEVKSIQLQRKSNKYYTDLLRKITKDNEVEVYYLKDKEPNAFNIGTTSLYYTNGLFDLLDNEDEMIAVLLHEYGHYKGSHVWISTGTSIIFGDIILTAVVHYFLYSITAGTGAASETVGWFVRFMIELFGKMNIQMFQNLTMGRHFEYVADSYAAKMGYGPELVSSLKKLQKYVEKIVCKGLTKEQCNQRIKDLQAFDEHPELQNRVENILDTKTIVSLITGGHFSGLMTYYLKLKSYISGLI